MEYVRPIVLESLLNPFAWNAPWFVVAAGLFVIVMVRANGTYWLGRALAAGTARSKHASMLQSPGYVRAARWIETWGAPVVTVSFLTIGLQTLVNLAAGATRMSMRRYLPAVTIGCVLWAMLYSTVGIVGFEAFIALHRVNRGLAWGLLLVAALTLVWFILRRVRAARAGRVPDPNTLKPARADYPASHEHQT